MRLFSQLTSDEKALVGKYLNGGEYYLFVGSGISLDSRSEAGEMLSASNLRQHLISQKSLPNSASLQQAYRTLTPKEVDLYLTKPYSCTNVGQTARELVRHRWKRAYTLNIDDCLEQAFGALQSEKSLPKGSQESFSHLDDFHDTKDSVFLSIAHLHGWVARPEHGYVFSHSEYAKNIARPNSWMLTLTQLLKVEPFIICGTSLDEIDVEYYLEQRVNAKAASGFLPTILVEPFPNPLTIDLCERNSFVLFEGTVTDFFNNLRAEVALEYHNFSQDDELALKSVGLSKSEQILFRGLFEPVPKQPSNADRPESFLIGATLTWEMMKSRADLSRELLPQLLDLVGNRLLDRATRVVMISDEPGSGKTALLRRLAFESSKIYNLVYFFSGRTVVSEQVAAEILGKITQPIILFVDNWADFASFFKGVLNHLEKHDILIVAAERSYRMPFIESVMSDEEFDAIDDQLEMSAGEANSLILKHEEFGFSVLGKMSAGRRQDQARQLKSDTISIACCRIQNNFRPFDKIVEDLINESTKEEVETYSTAAIARHCYSGGIRRSILISACDADAFYELLGSNARLPLVTFDKSRQFVIPARAAVADRVLEILKRENSKQLCESMTNLANVIAPRVNLKQIKEKSPEARLASRLLDYDHIIKRFIDLHAEQFYRLIKSNWDWNSRYWEQLALLKLDRYLTDKSDKALLDECIQHGRSAYAIERHPFSLTTLAKILFVAMEQNPDNRDALFEEAWGLVNESIQIESGWEVTRAPAFVVCFNGALSYDRLGGLLSGAQADQLRDIISATYRFRLRDPKLTTLRNEAAALA